MVVCIPHLFDSNPGIKYYMRYTCINSINWSHLLPKCLIVATFIFKNRHLGVLPCFDVFSYTQFIVCFLFVCLFVCMRLSSNVAIASDWKASNVRVMDNCRVYRKERSSPSYSICLEV